MGAVFIIDNDLRVRDALAQELIAEGLVCEVFTSVETFFATHPAEPEGCVVVEYALPGLHGLEFQNRLNELGWQIPRVFLTGPADNEAALVALRGESTTLIQKPYRRAAMQVAIHESLEINRQQRRERARRDATKLRIDSLTPSERKVLRHLIDGELNKVIAQRLDMGLRTVARHRVNALRKLGAQSIPQVLQMLYAQTEGKPIDGILSPPLSLGANRRNTPSNRPNLPHDSDEADSDS